MLKQIQNLTIGIEEEYQLIDPKTRELTSYISEILEQGSLVFKDEVKPELLQSQIEIGSQVCNNIDELKTDLVRLRKLVSGYAAKQDLSIIAAVLTIVGYSMNDTVVIFDRVRENLRKYSDIKIFDLTNISINETLSRTIITSTTTLLALVSIYIFGGKILEGFSLAMILGVIFGTYSSIYIANPILVLLNVTQKTILKEDKS